MVNIDISNAYPAILLHNTKISSYSIHDAVEKFNGCKTELDYRRVLRRGNRTEQLRIFTKDIEAAFYSNNLVRYLVEQLNMPLSV